MIKYILVLTSLLFLGTLKAQDDICVIQGEKMVFTFKRDWDDDKRAEVAFQYGLDSLVIAKALGEEQPTTMHFENSDWILTYPDANTVKLYKDVSSLKGKWNYKNQVLMSPEGHTAGMRTGPGYVDHDRVIFGVNKIKERVIVQYLDGSTKFILPGYDNADEVYITGSFSDWDMYKLPMKRTSGSWEITLDLDPGKYLYKFIVDGNWIYDPNNLLKEHDGYEGYNSIVYRYNTEFELEGFTDAKKVYLSGSFNDWDKKGVAMAKTSRGWAVPVYLKQGTYNYKFIVDKEWITDPGNPVERPDGWGNSNSVISIGNETAFFLDGFQEAEKVILAGNFNGWNESELIMERFEGGWKLPYALAPGNYEYKFIVDGEWITDPANPYFIYHGEDVVNSIISIDQNHEFVLADHRDAKEVLVTGSFTGWSEDNNKMVWKDGAWRFPIFLKPGKYTYKFLIDGEWINDPENPIYEDNEFGTGNSVLWIEDNKQLSLNNSFK